MHDVEMAECHIWWKLETTEGVIVLSIQKVMFQKHIMLCESVKTYRGKFSPILSTVTTSDISNNYCNSHFKHHQH